MKRKNLLMSLTLAGALSALGSQAHATSWMDYDDVYRGPSTGPIALIVRTRLKPTKSRSSVRLQDSWSRGRMQLLSFGT
jgi:hypothetical protein